MKNCVFHKSGNSPPSLSTRVEGTGALTEPPAPIVEGTGGGDALNMLELSVARGAGCCGFGSSFATPVDIPPGIAAVCGDMLVPRIDADAGGKWTERNASTEATGACATSAAAITGGIAGTLAGLSTLIAAAVCWGCAGAGGGGAAAAVTAAGDTARVISAPAAKGSHAACCGCCGCSCCGVELAAAVGVANDAKGFVGLEGATGAVPVPRDMKGFVSVTVVVAVAVAVAVAAGGVAAISCGATPGTDATGCGATDSPENRSTPTAAPVGAPIAAPKLPVCCGGGGGAPPVLKASNKSKFTAPALAPCAPFPVAAVGIGAGAAVPNRSRMSCVPPPPAPVCVACCPAAVLGVVVLVPNKSSRSRGALCFFIATSPLNLSLLYSLSLSCTLLRCCHLLRAPLSLEI